MKRNEKSISVAGIKILQLFVVIAIMLTAGIGFSGKVASATSEDDCIVLEACGYEEEDKKYNVGEYEIVISYEEMNIYKEGDLLNTVPYFAWNLGWIIDNKLYYTDRLDIYYFDFYTETMHEFMTIEPVKALSYEDWEPNVTEIILYQKPYLYLKIEQNSLYDYSLIRIDLNKKTQENIIEEAETIIRNLGVYNNYMYCAYPTHDGGYYNGFARISLGEYAKEERIEDNTSEVFMYENKIYYLRKNGNMNSVLKYYDVTSGTKNTLKTWKNHNIGIKKIKNGIIYLYGLQTNQEMQYNIKTREVKNVKYVKPLKGIKVTHKTIYSNKKSTMKDVCKISWDKSFTGKIEISYGTSNYRTDHYYGNNTKRVKATKKKNYCYLNLTSGKKYYIVVRAYKGKEGSEIYSVDSKMFAFNSRAINSMNGSKQPSWNYIKRGKNLYYSCKENGKYYIYKRNTKTGKQKTILKSTKEIYLRIATNRYFYYSGT